MGAELGLSYWERNITERWGWCMEIWERTKRSLWQVMQEYLRAAWFLHVTKYCCADPTKGRLNGCDMQHTLGTRQANTEFCLENLKENTGFPPRGIQKYMLMF